MLQVDRIVHVRVDQIAPVLVDQIARVLVMVLKKFVQFVKDLNGGIILQKLKIVN